MAGVPACAVCHQRMPMAATLLRYDITSQREGRLVGIRRARRRRRENRASLISRARSGHRNIKSKCLESEFRAKILSFDQAGLAAGEKLGGSARIVSFKPVIDAALKCSFSSMVKYAPSLQKYRNNNGR